jgi:diacylglycerol kinase (ATP)
MAQTPKSRPEAQEPAPLIEDATRIHKSRRGLSRWFYALGYSLQGLRTAWAQAAFRTEVVMAAVALPASFWLGQGWVEVSLLAGSVVLVLVVELLNTAIEAVVDRIDRSWHLLAKQAKDLGSAAVLLSLLFCMAVWGAALWTRWG